MPDVDRLRFALDHLRATDWEAFEDLCGAFLTTELPELRRIGGVGDKGRDAVFEAADMDQVVVQFSIQEDWKSKIGSTLADLKKAEVPVHSLIYVTNREIGPRADPLKSALLRKGISLDTRDRTYFLDRVHLSEQNRRAARSLSARVIDPLLPEAELTKNSPLADADLRAGLTYLELQIRDSSDSRNLKRLSYDALVLAALRDTDPDSRRSKSEVIRSVEGHLPSHESDEVTASVEGALRRLKTEQKIIVSGGEEKTYALHHLQRVEQADRTLAVLAERESVVAELAHLVGQTAEELDLRLSSEDASPLADALDRVLQLMLEREGHNVAEAVREQRGTLKRADLLLATENVVASQYGPVRGVLRRKDQLVELLLETAQSLFDRPTPAIQAYLRELSDAYTLLAFLTEAPDVQRAVSHFFSRGNLVLDTTVILPCFAETQLPAEKQRLTNLFRAAREVGMSLSTTDGVANEILTHLQRALTCSRTRSSDWNGPIPFAFSDWQDVAGAGSFEKYVEPFIGKGSSEDVEFFLDQALKIEVADLEPIADSAIEADTRHEFTELWRARKRIRTGQSAADRDLLLRHDVEMFFGVLGYRRTEPKDVFGYEAWWVTEDLSAQGAYREAISADIPLPSNPCMSPSFLSTLISLGPARRHLNRELRSLLPVALDIQRRGWGPKQLSSVANEIREKHADEPEWLIRKRIREAMTTFKEGVGETEEPEVAQPD